jgi:pimeloyl-ACP methyl ester carboxylesterase
MKPFTIAALILLVSVQFSCSQKPAKHAVKISDNGVNIAYTDSGKGDTTLLFVHGWCINKGYWLNQVKYFSKKYRVVTVDLPGFGASGKNRNVWNVAAFGRDIDSVMVQLDLKHVVLIGHSMAGDIVLQAAANQPNRVISIVGVDNFKSVGSSHTYTKKDTADYEEAIGQLKHHFKQAAAQYVSQDLFYKTTPDSIKTRVLNDVTKSDSTIAAACMMLDSFNETKTLIALKKKIYLINSDVKLTDTRGLKANNVAYRVAFIHATGHFPMIEKPGDFNKALEQMLVKM